MKSPITRALTAAAALAVLMWVAPTVSVADGANPCAANPCNPYAAKAQNPCAAKQNPCNPCAGASIDPARFQQPKGVKLAKGSHSELVARGEELWNDRGLGKTGLACSGCHTNRYGLMKSTFDAAYPHFVEMPAQRAGVDEVSAAEMVQFCMIVPMADDPLPWSSEELAALTSYVEKIQTGFEPSGSAAANPCSPGNPCNPCGGKGASAGRR
jgi:cytochrome c